MKERERGGEERIENMEEGDLLAKQNQNEKSTSKKMVLVKKGPFVVYFRNDATHTNLCIFIFSN